MAERYATEVPFEEPELPTEGSGVNWDQVFGMLQGGNIQEEDINRVAGIPARPRVEEIPFGPDDSETPPRDDSSVFRPDDEPELDLPQTAQSIPEPEVSDFDTQWRAAQQEQERKREEAAVARYEYEDKVHLRGLAINKYLVDEALMPEFDPAFPEDVKTPEEKAQFLKEVEAGYGFQKAHEEKFRQEMIKKEFGWLEEDNFPTWERYKDKNVPEFATLSNQEKFDAFKHWNDRAAQYHALKGASEEEINTAQSAYLLKDKNKFILDNEAFAIHDRLGKNKYNYAKFRDDKVIDIDRPLDDQFTSRDAITAQQASATAQGIIRGIMEASEKIGDYTIDDNGNSLGELRNPDGSLNTETIARARQQFLAETKEAQQEGNTNIADTPEFKSVYEAFQILGDNPNERLPEAIRATSDYERLSNILMMRLDPEVRNTLSGMKTVPDPINPGQTKQEPMGYGQTAWTILSNPWKFTRFTAGMAIAQQADILDKTVISGVVGMATRVPQIGMIGAAHAQAGQEQSVVAADAIQKILRDNQLDPAKLEDWQAAYDKGLVRDAIREAESQAKDKGLATAGVDMAVSSLFSWGLKKIPGAGGLLGGFKGVRRALGKGAAKLAAGGIGEASSEAGGELYAYGEVNPNDVIAEGLMGMYGQFAFEGGMDVMTHGGKVAGKWTGLIPDDSGLPPPTPGTQPAPPGPPGAPAAPGAAPTPPSTAQPSAQDIEDELRKRAGQQPAAPAAPGAPAPTPAGPAAPAATPGTTPTPAAAQGTPAATPQAGPQVPPVPGTQPSGGQQGAPAAPTPVAPEPPNPLVDPGEPPRLSTLQVTTITVDPVTGGTKTDVMTYSTEDEARAAMAAARAAGLRVSAAPFQQAGVNQAAASAAAVRLNGGTPVAVPTAPAPPAPAPLGPAPTVPPQTPLGPAPAVPPQTPLGPAPAVPTAAPATAPTPAQAPTPAAPSPTPVMLPGYGTAAGAAAAPIPPAPAGLAGTLAGIAQVAAATAPTGTTVPKPSQTARPQPLVAKAPDFPTTGNYDVTFIETGQTTTMFRDPKTGYWYEGKRRPDGTYPNLGSGTRAAAIERLIDLYDLQQPPTPAPNAPPTQQQQTGVQAQPASGAPGGQAAAPSPGHSVPGQAQGGTQTQAPVAPAPAATLPTDLIRQTVRKEFEAKGDGHKAFSEGLDILVKGKSLNAARADLIRAIFMDTDDVLLSRAAAMKVETTPQAYASLETSSHSATAERGAFKTTLLRMNPNLVGAGGMATNEPANLDPLKIFLHEFGHLGESLILTDAEVKVVRDVYNDLKAQGKILPFTRAGFSERPGQAEYYADNYKEFLAQAFAEYVLSRKVPDKRLKPVLKRMYDQFKAAINKVLKREKDNPAIMETLRPLFEKIVAGRELSPEEIGAIQATPYATPAGKVTPEHAAATKAALAAREKLLTDTREALTATVDEATELYQGYLSKTVTIDELKRSMERAEIARSAYLAARSLPEVFSPIDQMIIPLVPPPPPTPAQLKAIDDAKQALVDAMARAEVLGQDYQEGNATIAQIHQSAVELTALKTAFLNARAAAGLPAINLETSAERDTLWALPIQEITSAKTARPQVAATVKGVEDIAEWHAGTRNADIGGGPFDHTTKALAERGVENVVWDPFTRGSEDANIAAGKLKGGQADTATLSNVLNVIQNPADRDLAIARAADAIKHDGTAYFQIYEKDGTGVGHQTRDGWQNNQKASSYMPEILLHFKDVTRKGQLIIAKNPRKPAGVTTQVSKESDAQYMAAVESGDMTTAQTIVDWFAKAAGYTTSVFHGTGDVLKSGRAIGTRDFNQFRPGNIGALGPGIYVSPIESNAQSYADRFENPRLIKGYAKILNPFKGGTVAEVGDRLFKTFPGETDAETIQKARAAGYDAVWADQPQETKWGTVEPEINIFDPNQIKSADPVVRINGRIVPPSERFNPVSVDIRQDRDLEGVEYQVAQEAEVKGSRDEVDQALTAAKEPAGSHIRSLAQKINMSYLPEDAKKFMVQTLVDYASARQGKVLLTMPRSLVLDRLRTLHDTAWTKEFAMLQAKYPMSLAGKTKADFDSGKDALGYVVGQNNAESQKVIEQKAARAAARAVQTDDEEAHQLALAIEAQSAAMGVFDTQPYKDLPAEGQRQVAQSIRYIMNVDPTTNTQKQNESLVAAINSALDGNFLGFGKFAALDSLQQFMDELNALEAEIGFIPSMDSQYAIARAFQGAMEGAVTGGMKALFKKDARARIVFSHPQSERIWMKHFGNYSNRVTTAVAGAQYFDKNSIVKILQRANLLKRTLVGKLTNDRDALWNDKTDATLKKMGVVALLSSWRQSSSNPIADINKVLNDVANGLVAQEEDGFSLGLQATSSLAAFNSIIKPAMEAGIVNYDEENGYTIQIVEDDTKPGVMKDPAEQWTEWLFNQLKENEQKALIEMWRLADKYQETLKFNSEFYHGKEWEPWVNYMPRAAFQANPPEVSNQAPDLVDGSMNPGTDGTALPTHGSVLNYRKGLRDGQYYGLNIVSVLQKGLANAAYETATTESRFKMKAAFESPQTTKFFGNAQRKARLMEMYKRIHQAELHKDTGLRTPNNVAAAYALHLFDRIYGSHMGLLMGTLKQLPAQFLAPMLMPFMTDPTVMGQTHAHFNGPGGVWNKASRDDLFDKGFPDLRERMLQNDPLFDESAMTSAIDSISNIARKAEYQDLSSQQVMLLNFLKGSKLVEGILFEPAHYVSRGLNNYPDLIAAKTMFPGLYVKRLIENGIIKKVEEFTPALPIHDHSMFQAKRDISDYLGNANRFSMRPDFFVFKDQWLKNIVRSMIYSLMSTSTSYAGDRFVDMRDLAYYNDKDPHAAGIRREAGKRLMAAYTQNVAFLAIGYIAGRGIMTALVHPMASLEGLDDEEKELLRQRVELRHSLQKGGPFARKALSDAATMLFGPVATNSAGTAVVNWGVAHLADTFLLDDAKAKNKAYAKLIKAERDPVKKAKMEAELAISRKALQEVHLLMEEEPGFGPIANIFGGKGSVNINNSEADKVALEYAKRGGMPMPSRGPANIITRTMTDWVADKWSGDARKIQEQINKGRADAMRKREKRIESSKGGRVKPINIKKMDFDTSGVPRAASYTDIFREEEPEASIARP